MKNLSNRILTLLLAAGCSLAAQAREADHALPDATPAQDSLRPARSYAIGEVVVTGARTVTEPRHLSQSVSIIGRPTIERAQQPSLLPVLSEQVPGLFVTSRGVMGYGVSNGAAGNISLRGPASVLYGSNAMGGVVNIVTRHLAEDGVETRLRAGYGSYNTLESELTNLIRRGRFSSTLSGSYNRTDGHRADMGFEQYGGNVRLGYEAGEHWSLRGDVNVTHFNASYPGPVGARLLDGDQRITRGAASLAVENRYAKSSGGLSLFYNWGDHRINDGYTPSEGELPPDDRFLSYDDMMGASLYQSLQLFRGSRITLGADWFRYGGRAWNEYVSGKQAGSTSPLVDMHENEVAGYVDVRQDVGSWLTLNAGLRVDHHSRSGTEWVPQAGAAFHLGAGIELKLSASKGFRYPTLREMHMFPPRNPDLRPESMWNYEVAFNHRLGRLSYGVNLFYIDGKNLILTLPNPNGSGMLNQNSGRIENAGVELQAAWRIDRHWSLDGNYSFLHMEQPIPAVPEHKLYVGATFVQGRWSVTTGVQYIAGLYTQTDPVRTEEFVLWNLRASFRATRWLSLWARGENLLAQRYEINAGYPMPRVTAMGGIELKF